MSRGRPRRATWFFWIGVAMSASCLLAVLGRSTTLISRFEERAFPSPACSRYLPRLRFW